MLLCYTNKDKSSVPISYVEVDHFKSWLAHQDDFTKTWLNSINFKAKDNAFALLPTSKGKLSQVLTTVKHKADFFGGAHLSTLLPPGTYHFSDIKSDEEKLNRAIAWGLNSYQFSRYKKNDLPEVKLFIADKKQFTTANETAKTIHHLRDIINTPSQDMMPEQLMADAKALAKECGAEIKVFMGKDLLKYNYPTVHAVGRGSAYAPGVAELTWGNKKHPRVALVGKGVCFDSGGYDIKPADGMLFMKKDMAGAAHALALARLIMIFKLPVYLHVIIPAADNAISGNAFRPADIIKTRKGLTVEISNTDAEGRLLLCDALAAVSENNPEVIVDFATLTGAARVAVGAEISALLSNKNSFAQDLVRAGEEAQDLLWQLPMHPGYKELMISPIADFRNSSLSPFGGAITAALYLNEFVDPKADWAHIDMMAWNPKTRPGRPEGAEAYGVRAVWRYLQERYLK